MSEDDDEEFVDRPIPVDGLEEAEYGSRRLETPSIQRAREFLPWHRPRKQFVRRMWKGCLEDILKQREPDSEISYLGLPGADLLDLRFFGASDFSGVRWWGVGPSLAGRRRAALGCGSSEGCGTRSRCA